MNYSEDFKAQLEQERAEFLGQASQQSTKGKWVKSLKDTSNGPAITNRQSGYLDTLRRQLAEVASLYDRGSILNWLDENPKPRMMVEASDQIGKIVAALKTGVALHEQLKITERILNANPHS